MEILYLLIPMSVLLVFIIAAIFWWSLKSGQFEDLEGPGYRILMDDDRAVVPALSADHAEGAAGDTQDLDISLDKCSKTSGG